MLETGVSVVVMAGGKSSRMGTDKSFVPLLGRPMIEHVLERVAGLGEEQLIITNRPADYAYLGLPLYSDVVPDQGPLGGLHAALTYARLPHLLVVACDMPWLHRPLVEHMLSLRAEADAVVPRWQRFPEPLHAVYSRACLAAVEANLRAGVLKMAAFFDRVKVRYLDRDEIARYDPAGRSFANINTPEDLTAAGADGGEESGA